MTVFVIAYGPIVRLLRPLVKDFFPPVVDLFRCPKKVPGKSWCTVQPVPWKVLEVSVQPFEIVSCF